MQVSKSLHRRNVIRVIGLGLGTLLALSLGSGEARACGMYRAPKQQTSTQLFAKAQAFDAAANHERAVYFYEEVAERTDASRSIRAKASFRAYELRRGTEQRDAALFDLELAVRLMPNRAEYQLALGQELVTDKPAVARAAFRKALRDPSVREQAQAALAELERVETSVALAQR